MQPGRACFFAHLDDDAGVEAEMAARAQNRFHRREVHQMLALVVGCPAPIKAVAIFGQRPGIAAVSPFTLHPGYGVAVAIGQDGWQAVAFAAFGDQEWAFADGVRGDASGEAHAGKTRGDGLVQISEKGARPRLWLAFCGMADPVGVFSKEGAIVEGGFGGGDGGLAGHTVVQSCLRMAQDHRRR